MATTRSALALDLTALVERPRIGIDGVEYELRVANDFSAVDLNRLDRLLPQIEDLARLLETGEPTEAQCEALSAKLTQMCELAFVELPDDVLARQGDINKLLIFQVFLERLPPSLQRASALMARRPMEALPPPSASSSRASSGSTGGTRKRGGRASRSA